MRQTFRLRLEEIEGGFYNLSDEDGNKYSWTATGERPILLEGSMFDVTALVAGTYEHQGKTWVKLSRATFEEVVSVSSYFEQQLGVVPADSTLQDLPITSVCGKECKAAIDAAKEFQTWAKKADPAIARAVVRLASETVTVLWRG